VKGVDSISFDYTETVIIRDIVSYCLMYSISLTE